MCIEYRFSGLYAPGRYQSTSIYLAFAQICIDPHRQIICRTFVKFNCVHIYTPTSMWRGTNYVAYFHSTNILCETNLIRIIPLETSQWDYNMR